LHKGIEAAFKANNVVTYKQNGSMISVHFDATPVIDFKSAANGDNDTFNSFMDYCKIYIAPSAYESWFITDALSYEDLDFTIRAVDKVSKTF
jgi:glutamate-1-semialdehyde 2,1-aminomutase